jgi:hypothetical protein
MWTECGLGCAYWVGVATVQPALPQYRCDPSGWGSRDPNVHTIWSSGPQQNGATASFDFADIAILNGVVGQRVCLVVAMPFPADEHALLGTVADRDLVVPGPEVDPFAALREEACRKAEGKVARLRERHRRSLELGKLKQARALAKALREARSRRAASC